MNENRQVKVGDTIYRAIEQADELPQVVRGEVEKIWKSPNQATMLLTVLWEASPKGPLMHIGFPWEETRHMSSVGHTLFFSEKDLLVKLLASNNNLITKMQDEIVRLKEHAEKLRGMITALVDGHARVNLSDETNDDWLKKAHRWQCPWCENWTVKEIKAPPANYPAGGIYQCRCGFQGNGAYLLAHGCGGYRMLEADDEA